MLKTLLFKANECKSQLCLPVAAKCLSTKVTFDSGTNVTTSCCIAKDNGTVTLNSGANAEEYDIKPGKLKLNTQNTFNFFLI